MFPFSLCNCTNGSLTPVSLLIDSDIFKEGDGVVNTESQVITNVAWFKKHRSNELNNIIFLDTGFMMLI